jgi:hypothetical protein
MIVDEWMGGVWVQIGPRRCFLIAYVYGHDWLIDTLGMDGFSSFFPVLCTSQTVPRPLHQSTMAGDGMP